MATGFTLSPLVCRTCSPGSMPPEWRAQTEYDRCRIGAKANAASSRRPRADPSLSRGSRYPEQTGNPQFAHAFGIEPNYEAQPRCRVGVARRCVGGDNGFVVPGV